MKPCRLIYRSVSQPTKLDANGLRKMVNNAANNNRRMGINGILTVSNNCFLQVLEGVPKFVNQTFIKIAKDDRHRDIELISYEEIVKSEFSDWSMKLIQLDNLDAGVKKLLLKKYPVDNEKITFTQDAFLMMSLLIDIKNIAD